MPIDDELIVDLLMGQRIFISSIDLDKLSEHIEGSSGFVVANLTKEERPDGQLPPGVMLVVDPSRPEKNFLIPIDMLIEAAMNLIDMDCYIEAGKVMMDASEDTAHWIPAYAQEEQLWD